MSVTGRDFITWDDLKAVLALTPLGQFERLHRTPDVVVVGDGDNVQVGVALNVCLSSLGCHLWNRSFSPYALLSSVTP
jgi:hypothetical protein